MPEPDETPKGRPPGTPSRVDRHDYNRGDDYRPPPVPRPPYLEPRPPRPDVVRVRMENGHRLSVSLSHAAGWGWKAECLGGEAIDRRGFLVRDDADPSGVAPDYMFQAIYWVGGLCFVEASNADVVPATVYFTCRPEEAERLFEACGNPLPPELIGDVIGADPPTPDRPSGPLALPSPAPPEEKGLGLELVAEFGAVRLFGPDRLAEVDDSLHQLDEEEYAFVFCVLKADGHVISFTDMKKTFPILEDVTQQTRIYKRIPKEVRRHIESVKGRGYRMKPAKE